jgi:hypothetical protein
MFLSGSELPANLSTGWYALSTHAAPPGHPLRPPEDPGCRTGGDPRARLHDPRLVIDSIEHLRRNVEQLFTPKIKKTVVEGQKT